LQSVQQEVAEEYILTYERERERMLERTALLGTLLIVKSSPITGPEGPKGFQEVKFPRFRDSGTGWW
jgi:hypothetical protein